MLIKVAEKREPPVFKCSRPVVVLPLKAGNEVVDQLRDGSVLADHDEARRHPDAGIFPETVCLLVVTVECFESSLELWWQAERIEFATFAPPFLWHFRPNV